MPNNPKAITIEPCSECPVPTNFIIKNLPVDEAGRQRCGVECRECGDKWTEITDE
jgi:hypothetical protein